jgi:hypothetical protein
MTQVKQISSPHKDPQKKYWWHKLCLHLIYLILLSFFTQYSLNIASAKPVALMEHYKQWSIYLEFNDDGSILYRAISNPIEMRVYDGIRDNPYIAVTYIHPLMYTISVYPGFIIGKMAPTILNTIQNSYLLRISWNTFAYTYDSQDDVNILNDIISSNTSLIEIRSIDNGGNIAVDYYSTLGLKDAMLYMQLKSKK